MHYRQATLDEDSILITHYLAIWDSYGVSRDLFLPDAEEQVARFIAEGRARYQLGAVVAVDSDQILGSCIYQLLISPYPEVLRTDQRLRGYIWSVYVAAAARKQGVGLHLVERAVERLEGIGCTDVLLHASDAGQKLYAALGFQPTKEMRLKLRTTLAPP